MTSGIPVRNYIRHADHIATLALDLMCCVEAFHIPHKRSEKIRIKCGIHSGSVTAGVVGRKMPKYCIIGDTVNVASQIEITSLPMCIQVSEPTFHLLQGLGSYKMELRGDVAIKVCSKTWIDN